MNKKTVFIGVAVIAVFVIAAAIIGNMRTDSRQSPGGWSIARIRNDQPTITIAYLTIEPGMATQRAVYDDAVKEICERRPHGNICILGFYLLGDRMPSTLNINWEDTKPLAVWWGNNSSGAKEYTKWDCERAGVDGAPPSALCGTGVKEAYSAILSLGGRQGIGEFCRWPPRADIQSDLTELLAFADGVGRRAEFQRKFDESVASGKGIGIRNAGYDCLGYKDKIDQSVTDSMAEWRAAATRKN